MVDWKPLFDWRLNDYKKLDELTSDIGLEYRECPNGHTSTTAIVRLGFAFENLDGFKKILFNTGKNPAKCSECKADLLPSTPTRHFNASYLPLAKRDIFLYYGPGGDLELAMVTPGEQPIPISPDDPVLRELGPATISRGAMETLGLIKTESANEQFQKALVLWPEYPYALIGIGRILKNNKDLNGAKDCFGRALAGAPDSALANFSLADVLDETGDEQRALGLYDRAVTLNPWDPQIFVQRGVLKARLGMREAALPDYQQALAIDPHHDLALVNLAVNLHHLRRHEEIPEILSQLRPSDFRDETPLRKTVIGITMECAERNVRGDKMFDAARCYELAAGFMPNEASVLFNWGLCLANCGALADSAIRLRQALRLNPGHEKARNMLPQVEKACSKAGEALLAMHQHHSILYIDSTGRGVTMLNYLVKIETNRRYLESEVNRLSTSRDKDLVKLLVAKGHNKRVSFGMEGRTIEIKLKDLEPDPDFIALANASTWMTSGGKSIESAVVPVYLSVGDSKKERLLTDPRGGPPFRLNRVAEMDKDNKDERFYPPEFAGYDEDPK
jgi:tetratricopeptide (TPR) repeat protein